MAKITVNHYSDCSIYAVGCNICDCGEFRKIMPDIDEVDKELRTKLIKHQYQIIELGYIISSIPDHIPEEQHYLYITGKLQK
jgi:hypothetical protein